MQSIVPAKDERVPDQTVFGVSGSPRRGGNSDILLKEILLAVEEGEVASSSVNLTNVQFQGCIGCERCRKDKICTGLIDGMTVLYDTILSSRGLVLVSPTHNYNVTSWMKAFIDRLYCFYTFENDIPRTWSSQFQGHGRKAVVAAICEQEKKKDMGFTLEAMRVPLEALGYEIVSELAVYGIFDKGKVRRDTDALGRARSLGKKLVQAMKQ